MKRPFALVVLVLYSLFFLDMTLRWLPMDHPAPNLSLFHSIRHDWNAGGRDLLVNLVGNVVAFLPFGLLIPLAVPGLSAAWRVVLVAAAFSASVEVTQYLLGRRVADVDDVLLNATGALLGVSALTAFRVLRAKGRHEAPGDPGEPGRTPG